MIYLYNLILAVFFIPALLALAFRYRANLRKQYLTYLPQRFGFWDIKKNTADFKKPLLWIHCASLGEVRAVEPLILKLSNYRILLTVLTFSGRTYACENKLTELIYFAPVDFSFIVRHLMKAIKPAGLVLIETELWPGMLDGARSEKVPVMVVNARLSNRSFPVYNSMRGFWSSFLKDVSAVWARSQDDGERFIRLGVNPAVMKVTGNIKYDREFSAGGFTRQQAGYSAEDIIIVAGSTRSGENELIVEAWQNIRVHHAQIKLVLAPRHIERAAAIEQYLSAQGIACGKYSQEQSADCLLLDTFGDLQKFYSIADISFVGGSLVEKGGQNPIEPAAFGSAVVFGPHMENFLTEADILVKAGGAMQLANNSLLSGALAKLIEDTALRKNIGAQARQAVERQKGAIERTRELIDNVINNR
jgi:3-deoxy-D-manno-octulosonic-acid transferase